eukprot:11213484-Lingulodinium_polyedra.AAC.1
MACIGIMPLLGARWSNPWCPVVGASDVSEYGYGVASSCWNPSDVAVAGRVSERARFVRRPGASARDDYVKANGV